MPDQPPTDEHHYIEVYPDGSDKFRWRLCSKENGQTVGTSNQHFYNKSNARRAAESAFPNITDIRELPPEEQS